MNANDDNNRQPILNLEDHGADVTELQSLLMEAKFPPGPVDGFYGARTRVAVEAFQQSLGLPVDGIVGPRTWSTLRRTAAAAGDVILAAANPFDPRQRRLSPCTPTFTEAVTS